MGEENPQELAKPEQAGEQRTGKKAKKPLAQQTVDTQPQGQPASTPKAHSEAADEARRRQPTGKAQRQARQERGHQPPEVATNRTGTEVYHDPPPKLGGEIGKEQPVL